MSTSETEVTYITPGEEQTDDPKGLDLEEASNISQSNDWLSSPQVFYFALFHCADT